MSIIAISGKISSGKDEIGKIIQYLQYINYYDLKYYKYEDFIDDIREPINNEFEIKKFADKLKDMVCLLIGCTKEQLEDREFKEKELGEEWKIYYSDVFRIPRATEEEAFQDVIDERDLESEILTPRKLLQLLGTDCGRDIIHPNIWINALMSEFKAIDSENGVSMGNVIDYTNCIFPNWIITDMRFPNELQAIKDRNGITIRINRPQKNYARLRGSYKLSHPSETALDNAEFDYVIDNNGTIENLIEKVKQILIKEKII